MTSLPLTAHRRQGFALVMTLLLIAIAGAALGIVASRSMGLATQAEYAQTELQHEWGTRSVQRAVTPGILGVLQHAESLSDKPLIHYQTQLELNGMVFHMVFADEQAKTNLNTLVENRSEYEFEIAVKEILNNNRSEQSLRLDPLSAAKSNTAELSIVSLRTHKPQTSDKGVSQADVTGDFPRLGCLEQVWRNAKPVDLINLDDLDQSWTVNITLWGNGRVHFKRAKQESIYHATSDRLSRTDVEHMITLRDATPALGIKRALHELDPEIDRQVQRSIEAGLTDVSYCQSLWVVVDTGRCRHYHLAVAQQDTTENRDNNPRVLLMDW